MNIIQSKSALAHIFLLAWGLFALFPAQAQTTIDLGNGGKVILDGKTVTTTTLGKTLVINGNRVNINNGQQPMQVHDEAVNVERTITDLGGTVHGDVIQINLAGKVLFDFDSDHIGATGKEKLHQIASVIRNKARGGVLVIGHTDSKGSKEYNRQLSMLRAKAVIRWLHEQEKLPLETMAAEGAGADYPVAPNQLPDGQDNPEGRAQNRRVEIQIATRKGVRLGAGVIPVAGLRLQQPQIKDGPGSCAQLCELTAGRHSPSTIACMEGTFEELGYDMDEGSCNQLEDTMFLGMGNEQGKMCKACMKESHVSDAQCRKVIATCFR